MSIRYHEALDEASAAKVRLATATGVMFALIQLGAKGVIASICAYGGYLVNNGELTSGDIAKLLAQAMRVQGAASKFSNAAVRTLQALSASLKIEIPQTTQILAGEGLRPSTTKGEIELREVYVCVVLFPIN